MSLRKLADAGQRFIDALDAAIDAGWEREHLARAAGADPRRDCPNCGLPQWGRPHEHGPHLPPDDDPDEKDPINYDGDGSVPVLEESRAWHEALGDAGFVMVNVHQPMWYRKPERQVMVETFHG